MPLSRIRAFYATDHLPRRPQPGPARGDDARPEGLPHGRGSRRLPGRLQGQPRPAPGVRREARHRHADHRGGVRRRRRRRRDGRPAPDHRDDDLELLDAGHGPDRQRRRQDALHVGRPVQDPDRRARPGRRGAPAGGAALAVARVLVRARARPEGGRPVDAVRRQGTAQDRDPRRRPGHLLRGRDALRLEGRGARGRVRRSRSASPT